MHTWFFWPPITSMAMRRTQLSRRNTCHLLSAPLGLQIIKCGLLFSAYAFGGFWRSAVQSTATQSCKVCFWVSAFKKKKRKSRDTGKKRQRCGAFVTWWDTITARGGAADKSHWPELWRLCFKLISGQHYKVINSFNRLCPNQPIHTSWNTLASEDEPLNASVTTFFF